MDRWVGKVAIVTDANSGMGSRITEKLIEHGMKVVGLAVHVKQMEKLKKKLNSRNFFPYKMNITKEKEIKAAFKWSLKEVGPVSILVNSGGVVINDDCLTDGDAGTEAWNKMWEDVVMGIAIATREAINIMKDNNIPGHIVHMNTIDGHVVIRSDETTVYGPENFDIVNLTQQIRTEFNTSKPEINITCIRPSIRVSDIDPKRNDNSRLILWDPEDVANAIIYAITIPSHVQIHGLTVAPVDEK